MINEKENKLTWRFEASIDENESIIIKSTDNAFHSHGSDMTYRAILNTKEKLIREALIKLGWTPPKEEE